MVDVDDVNWTLVVTAGGVLLTFVSTWLTSRITRAREAAVAQTSGVRDLGEIIGHVREENDRLRRELTEVKAENDRLRAARPPLTSA